MLKEVSNNLTKELSKSPGWLPLSIIAFWFIKPILMQTNINLLNKHVDAVIIGLIAIFYLIGEMIDNIAFPRNGKNGWNVLRKTQVFHSMSRKRKEIRGLLDFDLGVYRLAKDFVFANRKSLGLKYYFIEIINNTSKVFRSLVVPLIFVAIYYLIDEVFTKGGLLLITGVILFMLYYFLKTKHMYLYYKYFKEMLSSRQYKKIVFSDNQDEEVEMYYWKKNLIYQKLK